MKEEPPKTFLDALLPETKYPYIAATKIWGYEPNKLTPHGISSVLIDMLSLLVGFMFICHFPQTQAQEPMIQYIGAAIMLGIMVLVFLPAMTRLVFGSYAHYIEGDDE
ncbi:MAG: hypothetical protein PHT77_05550 [Bacteroidales bacterium]|nr:hypothetical protein [Bacteroidales bacterium]